MKTNDKVRMKKFLITNVKAAATYSEVKCTDPANCLSLKDQTRSDLLFNVTKIVVIRAVLLIFAL